MILNFVFTNVVKNHIFAYIFNTKNITMILDSLKSFGADYVQMSGSGSTVFGVFSDFNLGKDTCTNLRKIWKECYCLFPNIQNTQMSSFS